MLFRSRVETFQSPELGWLGYIDADKVTFYRSPTRRHTARSEFDLEGVATLPRVDILYCYIEPNPALIAAVVSSGADATDFGAAARVYWTLKVLGLKELSVLNGGVKAWAAAGLPQAPPDRQAATRCPSRWVCRRPASMRSSRSVAP